MAVQLFVAAVLSVTVSMLIDPQRWFWGALAALVMLFGTSSAAEAIGKGARRVLGTAAALPVGTGLAAATHDMVPVVVALLLVAMFLQQYLGEVAYGWSIFFLTVFLYLVFALTGPTAADTIETRLLLTATGAGIGVVVALFVMPARSGQLLRWRAIDLLDAVDATVRRAINGSTPHAVHGAAVEADRRYLQLRDDAAATQRGWPFSPTHRLVAVKIDAASLLLRELQSMAAEYDNGHDLDADARSAAAGVLRSFASMRDHLGVVSPSGGHDLSGTASDPHLAAMAPAGSPQVPVNETFRRLQAAARELEEAFTAP